MTTSAVAARGSAIVLLFQAAKFILNFASIVVLARLISPDSYGLFTMVAAILGVASIFRDFGLSTAALQARGLTHAQQSNLFWINTGVGLALALITWLSATLISDFYGRDELTLIIHFLALTFFLNGASTQFKIVINRKLRFAALGVCDLLPYIAGLVVAITVAYNGFEVEALIAQQLVVSAASLVILVAVARWCPSMPSRAPMRELLGFGMSLAATQVLSYATRNVDSIAIGRTQGAADLGSYDRAYQLMITPLNQINTPLSSVAIPVLARIRDDREQYTAYLRRAQLIALYVTTLALGLLAALSAYVIPVLLGDGWDRAIPLVSILAIGGAFRSLMQICYWIYMSMGLASAQLRFFVVTQPLLIGIMLLGLPWGAEGVAVGHSIGYALYWLASLWWVGRVTGLAVGPMYGDAIRVIALFTGPASILAALSAGAVDSYLGTAHSLLVGILAAALWCAIAALLSNRIRADLKHLVHFARLAAARRRKVDA